MWRSDDKISILSIELKSKLCSDYGDVAVFILSVT